MSDSPTSENERTVADLRGNGYFLFPIPTRSKYPPPTHWPEAATQYDIPPGSNVAIGIRSGVDHYSILITNDEASTAWATARFGPPNVRSVWGTHGYFQAREGQINEPNRETTVGTMELHVRNKYAVIPPSIHPSGVAYAWVRGLPCVTKLPEAPDLRDLWHPHGGHHDELLRMSAAKAHGDLGAETIASDLKTWRDSHLPDSHAHADGELERMAKGSYAKFHEQAAAARLAPKARALWITVGRGDNERAVPDAAAFVQGIMAVNHFTTPRDTGEVLGACSSTH